MDLGCLDLGCISMSDHKFTADTERKGNDSSESLTATSKIGKVKSLFALGFHHDRNFFFNFFFGLKIYFLLFCFSLGFLLFLYFVLFYLFYFFNFSEILGFSAKRTNMFGN